MKSVIGDRNSAVDPLRSAQISRNVGNSYRATVYQPNDQLSGCSQSCDKSRYLVRK